MRQVATALSSRYNVTIREGKGWAMDIENRVMTYKPEHLLALDRDTCLGILLHELGHLHFTTNTWMEKSALHKAMPSIVFNAVNAYEDVRINEKMSQSYMGSRDLIEAMNELLAGDGVQKMLKMNSEVQKGIRVRQGYDMPEWFEVFYISMAKLLGDNLFPQYTPDMWYDSTKMEIINDIVREAEKQGLANMATTGDVYEFVERVVFPKIERYLPKPDPKASDVQQGDSNATQSTDEKGTKASGSQTNETNQEKVAEKKEEENEDGEESEDGEDGEEEDGEAEKKTPEEKAKEEARRGGHGVGSDSWKKELEEKVKNAIKRGRVNPDIQHRTQPFDRHGDKARAQHIAQSCNVERHIETSTTLARMFKNKFEVIFRDNQYARERANQRSGRLNKRVLHKFPLGKTRLFKRKIEIAKKSYAIGFALDLSGSMHGGQVVGSFHAMLAFTQTLEGMKIPHAVGFFSNESTIGKAFDKKMVARHMSLKASEVNNGGTRPDTLIRELFGKQLVAQNVKERIAIILTDGLWNENSYEELRKLKKDNPSMHIYAVTLMLHPVHKEQMQDSVGTVATVLHADSPEEIMDRYIAIAKKHLI